MKDKSILHPFILPLLPILNLAVNNAGQVSIEKVIYPSLVYLSATGILFGIIWLLNRNLNRSAMITTLLVVLFFSYGRLFEVVWMWGFFDQMKTLNLVLALVFCGSWLGAAILLWRTPRNLKPLGSFLTVTFSVLAVFLLGKLAMVGFSSQKVIAHSTSGSGQELTYEAIPPIFDDRENLPDIYYIILDGYARSDVLESVYGFDNIDFVNSLRNKGFYVAEESWSNYPLTFLSLASSLSMRYLDEEINALTETYGAETKKRSPIFYRLIRKPKIVEILKSKGYRYATVLTNWAGTGKTFSADITYDCNPIIGGEFYSVLLRTTALRALVPSMAEMHLFTLKKIEEMPAVKGPTFTFAHVLLPHNPYVFDRHGNEKANIPMTLGFDDKTGGWRNREGYVDQMRFLNKRLEELVDRIINNSPVRPIIIFQADHGSATTEFDAPDREEPLASERLAVFNAYFVPEEMKSRLYPGITPVNTFRILLSTQFQVDYQPLPDRLYYSWYDQPYNLQDVTDSLSKSK
ncbi:sulfatase-like hydrolase/transferase [Thermodesulfobacteriota bacterium]